MIGRQQSGPYPASLRIVPKLTAQVWCWIACGALLSACGGGGGGGDGRASGNSGSGGAPPSLSFSASATSVVVGDSVRLTWQSSNADSCQASGSWSGDKGASGSEIVGPLRQDAAFTLSCSGAGGGTLREVAVSVTPDTAVRVSLTSDEPVVLIDGQVQLSWTSRNANQCEASGGWTGPQPLSGTFTTPTLSENTTYRLTCFAQGESAYSMLTVLVTDPVVRWQAPTENADGTPLQDLAGFNVYWGARSRGYSGSLNLDAGAREWELPFGSGTYYIAVTAVNDLDEESVYSNEVRKIIP